MYVTSCGQVYQDSGCGRKHEERCQDCRAAEAAHHMAMDDDQPEDLDDDSTDTCDS